MNSFAADPVSTTLDETTGKIGTALKNIDSNISKAATRISKGITPGGEMRAALRELCTGKAYAIDCSFISAKGIMEIVEPEKYRKYEGTSLKNQPVAERMRKTGKPVLSELFAGTEGLQGVVFEYPVFDGKKEFSGSVSLFISPEILIRDTLKSIKLGSGMGITILQPDGTNIYCNDPSQIRLNVLKSTEYKGFHELRELGKRIVGEKEGAGAYRYVKPGTDIVLKKKALWKTVPFYDSYWRIVITSEEHRGPEKR